MNERLRKARQRLIIAERSIFITHSPFVGHSPEYWNRERVAAWAEWHAAVREYWKGKTMSRLTMTDRKLIDHLQRHNEALIAALKQINEWLLEIPGGLGNEGLWNEQFVKAHKMAKAALKVAEGR